MWKLKLTGLVVRDVELTKRKYLHPVMLLLLLILLLLLLLLILPLLLLKLRLLQLILLLLLLLLLLKLRILRTKKLGYIEICMELIRNTLCPQRLSSRRIRNASGTVDGICIKS